LHFIVSAVKFFQETEFAVGLLNSLAEDLVIKLCIRNLFLWILRLKALFQLDQKLLGVGSAMGSVSSAQMFFDFLPVFAINPESLQKFLML
jgi:hypothetical protein